MCNNIYCSYIEGERYVRWNDNKANGKFTTASSGKISIPSSPWKISYFFGVLSLSIISRFDLQKYYDNNL